MSSPHNTLFLDALRSQGYFNLVRRQGVWIGLHDYLTTRAIVVGLTAESYERRYCYPDRASADTALAQYFDPTTHPTGPWVKLKGMFQGHLVDFLHPDLAKDFS